MSMESASPRPWSINLAPGRDEVLFLEVQFLEVQFLEVFVKAAETGVDYLLTQALVHGLAHGGAVPDQVQFLEATEHQRHKLIL
jgi:hypothetical protein